MSSEMQAADFSVRRMVEFHETDAAGIMHFTTFFVFMESAEHAFLRQLGLSVIMQDDEGTISFPRVSVRCDFVQAVRFEDEVEIQLRVLKVGQKSIAYGFSFVHDGAEIAVGELTCVCCRMRTGQPPESIVIPEWIREKLPVRST